MKQVYIKFTIDLAPAFYIFLMMLLFPTVLKLAGVVAWSWLPVPCACESPMDSFYGHKLAQSLWSGEYGRARKRLLAFMIDCVQDDLSNPWW